MGNFITPSISAIRAGRRWAGASAIRPPPRLMVILLAWFGVIAVLLASYRWCDLAVLLYIGMLIGAQALPDDAVRTRAAVRPRAHAASWRRGARP